MFHAITYAGIAYEKQNVRFALPIPETPLPAQGVYLRLFIFIASRCMSSFYSYSHLYQLYDRALSEKQSSAVGGQFAQNALQRYLNRRGVSHKRDGIFRMQTCREALDALDRKGWQRSFHQRMFHENFIRACARVFYKTEPQGAFARAHQTILDLNGWDNLSQEILISTPRRRGVSPRPPSCRPRSICRLQWMAATCRGRRRGGCL